MKLFIDPLPMAKAARKAAVNEAFNASSTSHLDAAYAQKRIWAEQDREKLRPEADLRGVTVDELAESILSKPDLLAVREMERQRFMKLIDEAKTTDELVPENLSARKEEL
jgi:hypothetical protein